MSLTISIFLFLLFSIIIASIILIMKSYNKFIDLSMLIAYQGQIVRNYISQRISIIDKIKTMVTEVYNKYESTTLRDITKMRSGKGGGSLATAVTEAYPALKASENFSSLIRKIEDIEIDVTTNKNMLCDLIKEWNVMIKRFPNSVTAKLFRFKEMSMKKTMDMECSI